jgi:hypothetical protein
MRGALHIKYKLIGQFILQCRSLLHVTEPFLSSYLVVTLFSVGYEYDEFAQPVIIISAVTRTPNDITLSFWQQVDVTTVFRSYTKYVPGIRAQSFPLLNRTLTANMVKYHNFSFQTKPESESYRQPEDEPFLPSEYSQYKTRDAWHTYSVCQRIIQVIQVIHEYS